jgi:tRNA (uracil-5-)-methyltransferase TRM9
MNRKTILSLNLLNRDFYENTGHIWNPDPYYFWEGWELFLEDLNIFNGKNIKVLDLGCGNGRFANFLEARKEVIKADFEYLGLDFAPDKIGEMKLPNWAKIQKMDLIEKGLEVQEKFDLVLAFGLFHHIPSQSLRQRLFEQIAKVMKQESLFIFTTWQYLDLLRLQKRVIDLNTTYGQQVLDKFGIDKDELEEGDNILDWVKKVHTFRYAHYFELEEIKNYLDKARLNFIRDFRCDDRDGKRNRYYITKPHL